MISISSKRSLAMLAMGVGLALYGTSAWAHHPLTSKFDMAKTTTMSGVVTSVDWRNPHVHIFMNVTANRKVSNWAIELESPIELAKDGWSRETVHPGDKLTVKGNPALDSSRQVWGADLRYTETGALVFPPKPRNSMAPVPTRPTPRWPDGHPALGQSPNSVDGYWEAPSKTALVEDGVDVKMDQYGLLANLADAAKVAPMQPWALGVYQNRQRRLLKDDPTFINCKPPGGPRMYQSNLGIQFVEDNARKRIFVMMGSGNHNYRIIYLDGREQKGLVGGDDDNPLYFGRAVAKWEGDTLVNDMKDFNEDFWFTNGGLPHTSLLHLTERITRTDNDTLRYQVTVDDPGAYTRPWSATWTLKWNGGGTLPAHFCQNNRQ
ncbi:MAG: hypothetical protein RL328_2192 [Acidobacteriota bacterium]|jgi:hypothetical protein